MERIVIKHSYNGTHTWGLFGIDKKRSSLIMAGWEWSKELLIHFTHSKHIADSLATYYNIPIQ